MKGKLPVKVPDIVVILLSLGLTLFSGFAAYVKPQSYMQVTIRGSSQAWVFPLDASETVSVRGPLGNTVVRVHGSEAWVESSPCKNQTCVAMGHVRMAGGWAACLPNNVFFIIEGSDEPEDAPDSVTW